MLKDFRAFIMRGNVVDLAVAFVMGVAFATVVTAMVNYMISPLIAWMGLPDFGRASVGVGDAELLYGPFLNSVIAFVAVGAAVFFFVVRPLNRFMERPTDMQNCPHCLTSIPAKANVCSACTRDIKSRKATRR